jgi:hypothetical protein
VKTALAERDDALHRAREDLAGVRTVAAAWEAEVASARAQLQQDRAALEGARVWKSQAEEKVKEVEVLRTTLVNKAAALAAAEEQLRQEGAARQQAETQLLQERAALTEARAALERERLVREEVLTPKFGKESDSWVRFDEESVWWTEGSFQRYSAKKSAVGYLLRFGKGTVELILRDWTVTWLNQGRRMDG